MGDSEDEVRTPPTALSRVTKRIKVALDFATLFACVGIAGVVLTRFGAANSSRRAAPQPVSSESTELVRGSSVGRLRDVEFGQSDRTLIIFARSDCRYCTGSLPFFRDIANNPLRDPKGLQVVVVGLDSLQQTKDFLRQGGVNADRVLPMLSEMPRVRAVPTLVLVTRKGVIENVWIGEQPGPRRMAILSALRRAGD